MTSHQSKAYNEFQKQFGQTKKEQKNVKSTTLKGINYLPQFTHRTRTCWKFRSVSNGNGKWSVEIGVEMGKLKFDRKNRQTGWAEVGVVRHVN